MKTPVKMLLLYQSTLDSSPHFVRFRMTAHFISHSGDPDKVGRRMPKASLRENLSAVP